MSLLHPRFIHKADEFQRILKENSSSKEWLVGPYHLVLPSPSKSIHPSSSSEPVSWSESKESNPSNELAGLFLFDFPPHVQVSLNDVSIPMSCFDYLNPFIMTPAIRSQLEIFDSTTGRAVFELDCACLYHESFPIAEIIEEPFFYPPVYLINYHKMVFARSNRCKVQVVNAIERWISRPRFLPRPSSNFHSGLRPDSIAMAPSLEHLAELWLVQARANLPNLNTFASVEPIESTEAIGSTEPSVELNLSQGEPEPEEELD